jgi:hypothetical protein
MTERLRTAGSPQPGHDLELLLEQAEPLLGKRDAVRIMLG